MNCAGRGYGLIVDIRIALLSLGRDPYEKKLLRLNNTQKEAYLAELRAEQRAVGGILKDDA
jgi:hypothetical protein